MASSSLTSPACHRGLSRRGSKLAGIGRLVRGGRQRDRARRRRVAVFHELLTRAKKCTEVRVQFLLDRLESLDLVLEPSVLGLHRALRRLALRARLLQKRLGIARRLGTKLGCRVLLG